MTRGSIREYTEAVRGRYIRASKEEMARLIKELESQMRTAAKNLEFEKAALLRDRIIDLRKDLV